MTVNESQGHSYGLQFFTWTIIYRIIKMCMRKQTKSLTKKEDNDGRTPSIVYKEILTGLRL